MRRRAAEVASEGTDGPEAPSYFQRQKGVLALWFGFLGGGLAWYLHLNISYALVRYICLGGGIVLLHLTTLATVALAAAAVWVSWRSWQSIGEPEVTHGAGTLGRTRFMALGGLALSGFFLLIILMAWLPDFLLNPCAEL